MVPFITASLPGPEAAKQPRTITLPPPYFTAGMFFFLNAVLLIYTYIYIYIYIYIISFLFMKKNIF